MQEANPRLGLCPSRSSFLPVHSGTEAKPHGLLAARLLGGNQTPSPNSLSSLPQPHAAFLICNATLPRAS